jgi:transposase
VIPTTPEAYRKLVRGLKGQDAVFCYEAGPCGFDPYRMLHAAGADCDVIAHAHPAPVRAQGEDRPHRRPQPGPPAPSR